MAAAILAGELQRWRADFAARCGREPTRADVEGDSCAAVLLDQFRAARRREARLAVAEEPPQRPPAASPESAPPASPRPPTAAPPSPKKKPGSSPPTPPPQVPRPTQARAQVRRASPSPQQSPRGRAVRKRRPGKDPESGLRCSEADWLRAELSTVWQDSRRIMADAGREVDAARTAAAEADARLAAAQLEGLLRDERAGRELVLALWAVQIAERRSAWVRVECESWRRRALRAEAVLLAAVPAGAAAPAPAAAPAHAVRAPSPSCPPAAAAPARHHLMTPPRDGGSSAEPSPRAASGSEQVTDGGGGPAACDAAGAAAEPPPPAPAPCSLSGGPSVRLTMAEPMRADAAALWITSSAADLPGMHRGLCGAAGPPCVEREEWTDGEETRWRFNVRVGDPGLAAPQLAALAVVSAADPRADPAVQRLVAAARTLAEAYCNKAGDLASELAANLGIPARRRFETLRALAADAPGPLRGHPVSSPSLCALLRLISLSRRGAVRLGLLDAPAAEAPPELARGGSGLIGALRDAAALCYTDPAECAAQTGGPLHRWAKTLCALAAAAALFLPQGQGGKMWFAAEASELRPDRAVPGDLLAWAGPICAQPSRAAAAPPGLLKGGALCEVELRKCGVDLAPFGGSGLLLPPFSLFEVAKRRSDFAAGAARLVLVPVPHPLPGRIAGEAGTLFADFLRATVLADVAAVDGRLGRPAPHPAAAEQFSMPYPAAR
eukprot:TRINITY_DN5309_c1_g1_i1.p1 TRINITY_DN5309_c1_g1~~TRINITY_DN5309_c1_g1_i1.p1  ORF type:complete len:749 (+),score=181.24 TRINITY_DN5309_c1_g1_i1:73-2247(+)